MGKEGDQEGAPAMSASVERRRFRRAELDVPVAIRTGASQAAAADPIIGRVKDVSLAGVYCHVKAPCALAQGDSVVCSVVIPSEQVRWFPFSRIAGKGSIVRLEPIPKGRRARDNQTEEATVGVAIAFAPDVTALGTIEMY